MARTHRAEDGPLGGAVISQQIAARLLDEIRDGAYSAETKLPAEVELAANLGVSRTVIRDALAELEREHQRQKAVLEIKKKFGKNAILKGISFTEGATGRERNGQVGGHKA